jgi:FkbM family methyltransferase
MGNAVIKYADRQVTFCDVQPKDYIEGKLLEGQWYELRNLEFIRSLQVRGNYVDVGACIGTHSLFFSLFCPATQVYSFEANPQAYQKLTRNLTANGVSNCQTFNVGVSDVAGRATIEELPGEPNLGATWLWLSGKDDNAAVDVRPLDSFNLQNVRLMKIDVEGMELRMLHGAINILKGAEHLFIEMWSEPQSRDRGVEYTAPKITDFLTTQGFQLDQEYDDRLYHFQRK